MKETSSLVDDDDDEDDKCHDISANGDDNHDYDNNAAENQSMCRLERVREISDRNIRAVDEFLNDYGPTQEKIARDAFKGRKDKYREDGERRAKEVVEVGEGALNEARDAFKKRVEAIKAEKLKARRDAQITLQEAEEQARRRRELQQLIRGEEKLSEVAEENEEKQEDSMARSVGQESKRDEEKFNESKFSDADDIAVKNAIDEDDDEAYFERSMRK